MTTIELLKSCQEYYGLTYSPGQGRIVADYLGTLSNGLKDELFRETVKIHPSSLRNLPDVAVFESCVSRAIENVNSKPREMPLLSKDAEGLATQEEVDAFNKDMEALGYNYRLRMGA